MKQIFNATKLVSLGALVFIGLLGVILVSMYTFNLLSFWFYKPLALVFSYGTLLVPAFYILGSQLITKGVK